jgi:dUTP pyrophosphatase
MFIFVIVLLFTWFYVAYSNAYKYQNNQSFALHVCKIHKDAVFPTRGSLFSAGLDLHSIENKTLAPQERAIIRTGLKFHMNRKNGTYLRIAPRSGLSIQKGLDVMAGVVDADYTGEVMVIVINLDKTNTIEIKKSDKVAQIIQERIYMDELIEKDYIYETERGSDGFGSTGI